MNKYAEVTLKATRMLETYSPQEAWTMASQKVFPHSLASRNKGCPKSVFLGLCEEGLVRGATVGNYTRSILNKQYAIKVLRLLKDNTNLSSDVGTLWKLVVQGKQSNSQMDVVTALWNSNLINKEKI